MYNIKRCIYVLKPICDYAATAAKSPQLSPTLCDPIDCSPQALLSLGFSRQEYGRGLPFPSPMHACMLNCFSRVPLCATPWTAAHQAPPSLGFSRQEHWSGLSFPSPMHACMLSHFSRVRLYHTQKQNTTSSNLMHYEQVYTLPMALLNSR